MNMTLGKIAGKTLLAVAKCAGLVILSSAVGQALRQSTTRATEGAMQAFRYTRNKLHKEAA